MLEHHLTNYERFFSWKVPVMNRLPWLKDPAGPNKAFPRPPWPSPDAILEIPRLKRRLFIEYETGSNPHHSTNPRRRGTTEDKLAKYRNLFLPVDGFKRGPTAYQQAYPDQWEAELVFVVPGRQRQQNTLDVLEAFKEEHQGLLPVRVCTSAEVGADLATEVVGSDVEALLERRRRECQRAAQSSRQRGGETARPPSVSPEEARELVLALSTAPRKSVTRLS